MFAAEVARDSGRATVAPRRSHALVAEHDGEIIAAIDLTSGKVLADPARANATTGARAELVPV